MGPKPSWILFHVFTIHTSYVCFESLIFICLFTVNVRERTFYPWVYCSVLATERILLFGGSSTLFSTFHTLWCPVMMCACFWQHQKITTTKCWLWNESNDVRANMIENGIGFFLLLLLFLCHRSRYFFFFFIADYKFIYRALISRGFVCRTLTASYTVRFFEFRFLFLSCLCPNQRNILALAYTCLFSEFRGLEIFDLEPRHIWKENEKPVSYALGKGELPSLLS